MSVLQPESDVRLLIANHLKEKGIKASFLVEKTQRSNAHISFMLKCKRPLTPDLLKLINEALGTSFVLEADVKPLPGHSMKATG